MGTASERIRVSESVKRRLDRRRREGESYNDVLERVLADDEGEFYDGFGLLSDEEGERLREFRREAKAERKGRFQNLDDDG